MHKKGQNSVQIDSNIIYDNRSQLSSITNPGQNNSNRVNNYLNNPSSLQSSKIKHQDQSISEINYNDTIPSSQHGTNLHSYQQSRGSDTGGIVIQSYRDIKSSSKLP